MLDIAKLQTALAPCALLGASRVRQEMPPAPRQALLLRLVLLPVLLPRRHHQALHREHPQVPHQARHLQLKQRLTAPLRRFALRWAPRRRLRACSARRAEVFGAQIRVDIVRRTRTCMLKSSAWSGVAPASTSRTMSASHVLSAHTTPK